VNINPVYKRMVWLVLLLLPDDAPVTRRAVMRAGVWLSNQRGGLSLAQRKRLVTGAGKAHKTFISIGVGVLTVLVQHAALSLAVFLLSLWMSWEGITRVVRLMTGAAG